MAYLDFEELPKSLQKCVEDYAEMPNKIDREVGRLFAGIYLTSNSEVFYEIIDNEIDFDDLKVSIAQSLYTGYPECVYKSKFKECVNYWFTEELKQLVEEYNYENEESSDEKRADFEKIEARGINASL